MPFDAPITISGNVWLDANGDAVKASESFTNAGGLNAVLTDNSGNVIQTAAVAAGGAFSFSKGASSENYKIVLTTTSPVAGTLLTASSLPAPGSGAWANTGVNPGGSTPTPGNRTGILSLTTPASGNVTNQNFGIEQTPVADAKAFTAPNSAFTYTAGTLIGGVGSYAVNANSGSLSGSAIKSLSGTDAEDCATASSCTTARTYKIQTINSNTRLFYSGSEVFANSSIPSFDPANLTVYGQRGQGFTAPTALGFTYSLVDAAGVASALVTYAIQTTTTPLPITLISFEGAANGCTAELFWTSGSEKDGRGYELEQSADGQSFRTIYTVACKNPGGDNSYRAAAAMNGDNAFFRLKLVGLDGRADYSQTIRLNSACGNSATVAVYPNPASQSIRLSGIGTAAAVKVFDLTGRLVLTAHDVSDGEALSVASLPAGGYLLEVSGNGLVMARLRLQKQ